MAVGMWPLSRLVGNPSFLPGDGYRAVPQPNRELLAELNRILFSSAAGGPGVDPSASRRCTPSLW